MEETGANIENFFDEDSNTNGTKIPYDDVPIERGGYNRLGNRSQRYYDSRPREGGRRIASSRSIVIISAFIALFLVLDIVLGAFIYRLYTNNVESQENVTNVNYSGDIYSSSTDMQLATSRGYMSTCMIQARISENDSYPAYGSGVIINIDTDSGDLIVVTNYHVVHNSNSRYSYIYATLPDSTVPLLMDYVGGSINYDVAVLKVSSGYSNYVKESSSRAATIADSNEIYLGEPVIAIGNSRAEGLQATSGIISLEEEIMNGNIVGGNVNLLLLRHSAEINGGNSGGGLYDLEGRFVGLVNGRYSANSSVYSSENIIQGMNYAVPSLIVSSIVNNIINDSVENSALSEANLQRPDLGLYTTKMLNNNESEKCLTFNNKRFNTKSDSSLQINYSTEIDYIPERLKSTTLFQKGDVLHSFKYNGKVVECNRMFSLESHIYNFRKGDVVTFYVKRQGNANLVELNITISTFIAVS